MSLVILFRNSVTASHVKSVESSLVLLQLQQYCDVNSLSRSLNHKFLSRVVYVTNFIFCLSKEKGNGNHGCISVLAGLETSMREGMVFIFFFLSTDFLATPLQRFSHFLQELNISNGKENSFKICLSFFLVENNLSLMWNLCTFHLC